MTLPPRSEWEQRTAAAYNAVAQFVSDNHYPLSPDDMIIHVRGQMGNSPSTLDLGCGWGRMTPLLKGFGITRIVGVDYSEELIQIAKIRYPEYDFRVGDILNLKEVVGDEKFDAFWALSSLMHILPENIHLALTSIREVLRTGAIGFIATPWGDNETLLNAESPDMDGGKIPEGHFMFRKLWTKELLASHFKKAGFRAISPTFDDRYMINMTVQAQ